MIQVVTDLALFQKAGHEPLVVAVGNFDGVHLGHQAILRQIRAHASKIGGKPAVLTFEKHPQRVLHQKGAPLLLTSLYQKLALLEKNGIALCILEKFTPDFAKQPPEEFVREILVGQLGAKAVCIGFNAKFGQGRSGDARTMRDLAERFHFEFLEVEPVQSGRVSVSSTEIRASIAKGDLKSTERFLGRPFSIFGRVERGSGRGAALGFPTANLRPESEVFPPFGVYAAKACLIDEKAEPNENGFCFERKILRDNMRGVLNYGFRPTFEDGPRQASLELHLLGEDQDFLGMAFEVDLIQKLRDEKKFESAPVLASQIREDIKNANAVFSGKMPSLGGIV